MHTLLRKSILVCSIALFPFSPFMAQDSNNLAKRAMDYVMQDSLEQAETFFRRALQADPKSSKNALLFSNLGSVQKRMGKIDEAIESYTMALNITPYATSILLNRGAAYLDKGNTDKAYIDYCKVIDLLPENEEARLFRAYICMQKRQYKEARIDYNVILNKNPGHRSALLGMVMLDQNEHKLIGARERIDKMITESPNDFMLYKIRANIELEMNSPEMALLDLQKVVALDADDIEAYILMGDINCSLKHKDQARKAYEKAIGLGVPREELREKLKKCR